MIDECLVVEVRVTGDDCPLAAATRATGTRVEAEPPLLRRDGNALLRFSAPRGEDLAGALDADEHVRYLHRSRGDGRDRYRCLSMHACVVHDLIDAGFMAESLTYAEGEGRFEGAVVGREVLRGVMEAAGEAVGVTLERVYPLGPQSGDAAGRWDVTPAQEAALRAAMAAGYFSVPKGATAQQVADHLDISKSAFLERLRRGQATLFAQVLGEEL
ncbi:helix-turn-helix domain-containing protein [Halorarum halophilum]|uniref:Helix-turn-helix domain-containing protein n=1 Tax=Halorarum halophilum TaxID=2743090 RepID=A0A7D5KWJ2_9EURY|nr:helix-turn-helix domain-containing protein [Halobaculum halophilum]QLG26738.1 helix-turn-helix domain-containing protein [Halobaculum halophilum]